MVIKMLSISFDALNKIDAKRYQNFSIIQIRYLLINVVYLIQNNQQHRCQCLFCSFDDQCRMFINSTNLKFTCWLLYPNINALWAFYLRSNELRGTFPISSDSINWRRSRIYFCDKHFVFIQHRSRLTPQIQNKYQFSVWK